MPISTIGSNSLNQTSDLTINGQTVGKGGGNVATNTVHGYQALNSNTTGATGVAIGYQAGYTNSTGPHNTFVGAQAGYSSTGGENTCVGRTAGYSISTGTGNTFVGPGNGATSNGAGYYVTTGSKNSILGGYNGNQGGLDIRTASNYVVLSDGDGNPRVIANNSGAVGIGQNPSTAWSGFQALTIGQNTAIWSQAGSNGTSYYSNNIYYDGARKYTANGYAAEFQLGNSGVISTFTASSGTAGGTVSLINGPYVANGGTSWTSSSDERLKNITGEIENALDKVSQLRAAKFTWKSDADNKPQVGLIAQDVQAVLPEVVNSTAYIIDDETEYLGVNYDQVIPLLVASIKELKTIVDAQAAEIAELKAKVA